MLNFGYWTDSARSPLEAQHKLCAMVGKLAELSSAKSVLDVGSGLSAPAAHWRSEYSSLNIACVNINPEQLRAARNSGMCLVNATSTSLPFACSSVDRVIALESAQHFRPLAQFVMEAWRVLKESGLLVMAIPVMNVPSSFSKLGILSMTWSSEHYELSYVKSNVESGGFVIEDMKNIGSRVYEPLADYYVENRQTLRSVIREAYPSYLEDILYRSILKMKVVSKKGIIDYALIKARKI